MENDLRKQNTKLTKSKGYAKIENLYTTVKAMYENGSKQSFMTLNLQYIATQMTEIAEMAPEDCTSLPHDVKKLISRDAKTFYMDYIDKGFYLIENYIGFVYCIMTLMSKSVIFSTAVFGLLQGLSKIDGVKLFQLREQALWYVINENNVGKRDIKHLSALYEPEDEQSRIFKPLETSTPIVEPVKTALHDSSVYIKEEKGQEFLQNLPAKIEKVILKPSPFEGNFSTFYNDILKKLPTAGYQGEEDKRRLEKIPTTLHMKDPNLQTPISKKLNQSKLNTPEYNPPAPKMCLQTPMPNKYNFKSPVGGAALESFNVFKDENFLIQNRNECLRKGIMRRAQLTPEKRSSQISVKKMTCQKSQVRSTFKPSAIGEDSFGSPSDCEDNMCFPEGQNAGIKSQCVKNKKRCDGFPSFSENSLSLKDGCHMPKESSKMDDSFG